MVVEEKKEKRLKEYGLSIKTIFRDGNETKVRNTDHSKEDPIEQGVIIEKDYIKAGKVLKKENIFDSRILYCYQLNQNEKAECKNCGMTGSLGEFTHGCPYCHTTFNMEYHKKELGSKHYYDLTIKNKKYLIVTYIIDLIVSFMITLTFIMDTSRTFYFFDMVKVLIGTILISLLLYYVFYYVDALFLLPGVKKYKEMQNRKQEAFWLSLNYTEEEKTKFYNNINYALREYYFGEEEPEVIDFDIIDYDSLEKDTIDQQLFVNVTIDIRIVRYQNNKVISKKENKTYRFRKVKIATPLEGGMNYVECPGCGASISVSEKECEYCGHEIHFYQEWYLEKSKNGV
ncbi:MAG: hypothetical protein J6X28_03725 [Bacilli bacterium]|nr:hypothetical protein [Bacilli bacterium]